MTDAIIPAHLEYLSVFCPELQTAASEEDQLVFHYARAERSSRRKKQSEDARKRQDAEAAHKRLKQVGLVQGISTLARSFQGDVVDSIETETHRIVLKELESGWFILASIALTRLPFKRSNLPSAPKYEYSSREVIPAQLVTAQLLRAYHVFLLHHGGSLQGLYKRLKRSKFCNLLDRYWTQFISQWQVMLQGNPCLDFYDGTKVAAGGELGGGEGEELYGSSERDTLEGLVRSTDGLIDLVVSRSDQEMARVVFSGTGALSRHSVRTLTDWICVVHADGDNAYGVGTNPTSERSSRKIKTETEVTTKSRQAAESLEPDLEASLTNLEPVPDEPDQHRPRGHRPTIPPPLVDTIERSLRGATKSAESRTGNEARAQDEIIPPSPSADDAYTYWDVLTLGYGKWGSPSSTPESSSRTPTSTSKRRERPNPSRTSTVTKTSVQVQQEKSAAQLQQSTKRKAEHGHFLIGLLGDLDQEADEPSSENPNNNELDTHESANRLLARTAHVEVNTSHDAKSPASELRQYLDQHERSTSAKFELRRVRVVVFEHHPFIYTLLFNPTTPSLAMTSFYHDLQKQLQPLHARLLEVTSPARMNACISSLVTPHISPTKSASDIYHLIHNPIKLTTHSNLPSIPDPTIASSSNTNITRLDAIHLHTQALAHIADTRTPSTTRERAAKTARGWWVIWIRIPSSPTAPSSYSFGDATASQSEDEAQGSVTGQGTPSFATEVSSTPAHSEAIVMWRAPSADNEAGKESGRSVSSSAFSMMGLGGMPRMLGGSGGSDDNVKGGIMGGVSEDLKAGVDVRAYVNALIG